MKLDVMRPTGASTGKHEEGGLKFNAQWNYNLPALYQIKPWQCG